MHKRQNILISRHSIIAIIAAYNEEKNITSVLSQIPNYVDFVVVVDDGSSDETPILASEELQRQKRGFIVISHLRNKGQGASRATGARYAIGDLIDLEYTKVFSRSKTLNLAEEKKILVFLDGDGQLDPKLIGNFARKVISSDLDFVKGNRFSTPNLLEIMPKSRVLGNVILSAMTKVSSGYWYITDSQCGYFALHERVAKQIKWEKLRKGYGQINDIIIRLNELDARVGSVPVPAIYGVGEISGIRIPKVIFPILSLCLRGFTRRVFFKHLIWKTHPLAFFYILGFFLLFLDLVLVIRVFFLLSLGEAAPPLTSTLAMILFALGSLCVFQGISLDLMENQKLHTEEFGSNEP